MIKQRIFTIILDFSHKFLIMWQLVQSSDQKHFIGNFQVKKRRLNFV